MNSYVLRQRRLFEWGFDSKQLKRGMLTTGVASGEIYCSGHVSSSIMSATCGNILIVDIGQHRCKMMKIKARVTGTDLDYGRVM